MQHYEELRRRAVGGEPDGWRLGLAVLQRQGVAGWIRAWEAVAPGAASGGVVAQAGQLPGCAELVAVLAGMALRVAGG